MIIAVLFAFATCAFAQTSPDSSLSPEEFILGTTSPDLLLQRGDVRDDLQLSTEQTLKIIDIQQYVADETQAIANPPTEGDDTPQTSFEAVRRYAIDQVDQVLTPDQMKRLKQIALQLTGYSALARTEVQKQLDLPKDVAIKVYDLANEEHRANESVMDKFQSGELTAEQFPQIIKKNRQILNNEIAKVLPQSVKDRFKALGGRPFKASTTI